MTELGISRGPAPVEARSAGDYTDQLLSHQFGLATTGVKAAATGGLQAAAGIVGRALATAEVDGDMGLLTPGTMQAIGYDLVRHGLSRWLFRLDPLGRPKLLRASSAQGVFGGGADPDSWRYTLTLNGPGQSEVVNVGRDQVIDVRINTDPSAPWRGRAPLEVASLTGRLMAGLEDAFGSEAAVAVARFIPAAVGMGEALKGSVRAAMTDPSRGRVLIPETALSGFGGGRSQGPAVDWKASRVGPMYQAADPAMLQRVSEAVAVACGVPPALVSGTAAGPSVREAWRGLTVGTIQPWSALIAAEASRVLETPVTVRNWRLAGVDSAGRARALGVLVKSGVPVEIAQRMVGWE